MCDKEKHTIVVERNESRWRKRTVQINSLPEIAESAVTVRLNASNNETLKAITCVCKNVTRIELALNVNIDPIMLQRFEKLADLELFGDIVSVDRMKEIVHSVPHLESLAMPYHKDYIELLDKLENLKSLWLYQVIWADDIKFECLARLNGLKKVNIGCNKNGNKILEMLAKALPNLEQLTLHMPYNGETFRQIKKFKKLEVLRMERFDEKPFLSASDLEGLNSNIKRIQIIGAKMTFTTFSQLMEHFPSLDCLGIGDIYYDIGKKGDKPIGLEHPDFIFLLEAQFQHDHRKFTIEFSSENKTIYKQPLTYLKMVNTNYRCTHACSYSYIYI